MSFICESCSRIFGTKIGFQRHVTRVHKAVQFNCNECNKSFQRKDNLVRHIQNHKRKENGLICTECKKSFQWKYNLVRHVRSHKRKKRRLGHQTSQFICDECNKSFGLKRNLMRHMRTHTLEENRLICNECNKSFQRKDHLIRHVRNHTLDKSYHKNYECNDCPLKFNRKYNIERHIRLCHLNKEAVNKKRAQKCLHCGASFTIRNALTEHYKEAHNIELRFEYLRFSSIAKVQQWISPCYFNQVTWKTSADFVRKYRCHRSGYYIDHCEKNNLNRKRHLKIAGTKKLQGVCPAVIIVRESRSDKSCVVSHQTTHVGHDIHDENTKIVK